MNLYEKIRNVLAHAGLSEHEIVFYTAVLKNPYVSIHTLSKKSGLNKNAAYRAFSNLKELGIVGYAQGGSFVIPVTFKNLIDILNKKSRRLGRVAGDLEKINKMMPFLRKANSAQGRGEIHLYDSLDDIKNHYLDTLDLDWQTALAYGSFEMFVKEMDPEIEGKFIAARVKKGRKARGLYTDDGPFTRELVSHDGNELRTSRFVETKQITNKWFHVFPDNDLLVLWSKDAKTGEFSALSIENKSLADFHRALFESDWRTAEKGVVA